MEYEPIIVPSAGEKQFLSMLKGFLWGLLVTTLMFGLFFYNNYTSIKELKKRLFRLEDGVSYVISQNPQTKIKTRYILLGMADSGVSKPQAYLPLFVDEKYYQDYYTGVQVAYSKYLEQVEDDKRNKKPR